MATRADFYVFKNGTLEFLGCTSNSYSGDFENSTTEKHFRDSVNDLLIKNHSEPKKWYWPWKNSKLTDEVFIFKVNPKTIFSWFMKEGYVMCKIHNDGNYDNGIADFVKYTGMLGEFDTTGMHIQTIQLPNLKQKD